MRSSVFLAIIALCAIADGASAVARAGGAGSRAGKSSGGGRSSNGSNTGGDRDRPGKTKTTAAARRKRDKAVFSNDGAKIGGRDPSTVVIGAVREERAHQVRESAVGKDSCHPCPTGNQRPEIMRKGSKLAPHRDGIKRAAWRFASSWCLNER